MQLTIAYLQLAAALVGAPVFFESAFKRYQPWYAIGFLAGCFALLAVSAVYIVRGHRLIKAEMYLGYTTILKVARRVPGIFLFDPVTKTVLAVPGEPLPTRMTKPLKKRRPPGNPS